MLYYKVKQNKDQTAIYTKGGKYKGFLVGNELYTQKELEKLLKGTYLFNCYNMVFDPVWISKNRVYSCFGARFEIGR